MKYEGPGSVILPVYVQVARSRPVLVACALLVVGSLFAPWTRLPDGQFLVVFGALDKLPGAERSGWSALAWLDLALVAVAAVVVAAAFVRAARLPALALCGAAAVAVVITALDGPERRVGPLTSDAGRVQMYSDTETAVIGPALCLLGLVLASAALFLRGRAAKS